MKLSDKKKIIRNTPYWQRRIASRKIYLLKIEIKKAFLDQIVVPIIKILDRILKTCLKAE